MLFLWAIELVEFLNDSSNITHEGYFYQYGRN